MNTSLKTTALVATLALPWLAGCGGGGGIEGTGANGGTGTMRLSITDAPSCGYDAVHLTISKIRVHKSASAGDGDAGWSEVVLAPARRVELLSLTNGVLESLGETALPAGRYTQMRLVLAANGGPGPLANSVTPSGGSETALTTPSAQQSGLKLNIGIDIPADKVADFAIDFDACKSIVKRGNSGQYNLKPVVTVLPILSDAGLRVVGYVGPALANSATNVSVQFDGVPVKATVPDISGRFELYPVPAGSYDLVVAATGRVTAVMTGVPVVTTARTFVNTLALPILPPLATLREVNGKVTPASATVRAQQMLAGGGKVEIAWGAIDADSGDFTFDLPIEAPLRTAYVANPLTLTWVTDAAVGQFRLEAAYAGAIQSQIIDATAPVPLVNFSFP